MRVLGDWRGTLWRTGVGLAAFCFFCPSQWENFMWGFQVCFVLPQSVRNSVICGLLLYWSGFADEHPDRSQSSKFLVLSILAALGANYSLSNGNLLWPLLVGGGSVSSPSSGSSCFEFRRRRAGQHCALFPSTMFARREHARPARFAWKAPLMLLKYLGMYFGGSWIAAQHRRPRSSSGSPV